MLVNERDNYIAIGTAVNDDNTLVNELRLPAPVSCPASAEFEVKGGRNAKRTMVFSQVGRTQYKSTFTWGTLTNKQWWAINRWFLKHGYAFYVRFFDHTVGAVKIQRFYRGNLTEPTPSTKQEIINGYSVPVSYSGAGFSVIDMGESNVKTIKELSI